MQLCLSATRRTNSATSCPFITSSLTGYALPLIRLAGSCVLAIFLEHIMTAAPPARSSIDIPRPRMLLAAMIFATFSFDKGQFTYATALFLTLSICHEEVIILVLATIRQSNIWPCTLRKTAITKNILRLLIVMITPSHSHDGASAGNYIWPHLGSVINRISLNKSALYWMADNKALRLSNSSLRKENSKRTIALTPISAFSSRNHPKCVLQGIYGG